MNHMNIKIGIIGLGYVGLPLAVAFGKKVQTIGFDLNENRVSELKIYKDRTLEISSKDIEQAKFLRFTTELKDIQSCNFYIITVPTPVDKDNQPDLENIIKASENIGLILSKQDIVVYESTVYPGTTEDICVPILEKSSNLTFNKDFFVGYSPERINPGDKTHTLTSILKITSGSTPEIANYIDDIYNLIIEAGTYKAPSIKVAETAKALENTQRDVNIALMNELAIICNKLKIDTEEVIKTAETKWNFLSFRPGLVGGHCIGVDPYYLAYKAQALGHQPDIILASRKLNDSMPDYVTDQLIQKMLAKNIKPYEAKILILGVTFKENCPDIRNSKIINIIQALNNKINATLDVFDPWADNSEMQQEYNIKLIKIIHENYYDAILISTAHNEFKHMGANKIRHFGKSNCVLYDLKSILNKNESDLRL